MAAVRLSADRGRELLFQVRAALGVVVLVVVVGFLVDVVGAAVDGADGVRVQPGVAGVRRPQVGDRGDRLPCRGVALVVVRAADQQVEAHVALAVDVGAQGEDQAVGPEADLADAVAAGERRVVPPPPQRQHLLAERAADQEQAAQAVAAVPAELAAAGVAGPLEQRLQAVDVVGEHDVVEALAAQLGEGGDGFGVLAAYDALGHRAVQGPGGLALHANLQFSGGRRS
ncbi:hypothetical protein ACN6LC_004546 [Streptomyces violaceoruber]|uniref:hypothetical protein n=1 Tax=Streptomyces violaceoruber group TaxID=2867121 RepID=UPI0033CB8693